MSENDLSNLLVRLRDADLVHQVTHVTEGSLWGDAADAIELLHAELASLRRTIDEAMREFESFGMPEVGFPTMVEYAAAAYGARRAQRDREAAR